MKQALVGSAAVTFSAALHTWALLSHGGGRDEPRALPPTSIVELSVAPHAVPVIAPETPSPPRAPEEPRQERPVARPTPAPLPEPAPHTAARDPETVLAEQALPVETPGSTLDADRGDTGESLPGGAGAVPGAGRAGTGSLLRGHRGVAHAAKRAERPAPPAVVPLKELSRRPEPPPLQRVLERNYPAAARSVGLSGEARVRARIEASGQVRLAQVSFESSPGFGDACRITLLESRWSGPLDRHGRPVATWVTYRCKFRVGN